MENNEQNTVEQNNMYTSVNNSFNATTENKNDKAGAWWLLGLFFPLIGIILFFVWKKETPKKAKSCLIGSIVSVGLSVILGILISIFVIAAGTVASTLDKTKENAKKSEERLKEYEKKVEDALEDNSSTKEITIGKWDNNIFTNEFLNIKFIIPEGYSRLSDEEILEKMNIGKEALEDEGYKVSDINTVYHLMATDNKTNENVILISEKAKYQTVNTYINTLKRQLSSMETIKYTLYDPKDETVNGISFKTLEADGVTNGTSIKQKYLVQKNGDYITSVIITSNTGQNTIDSLQNSFSKLN